MGNVVIHEHVFTPTCGQMFDALRNIQECAVFSNGVFQINGFPVAVIRTVNLELNHMILPMIQILEKKPIKEGIPGEIEKLIGRHNGVALVNNTLLGIIKREELLWEAKRELRDSQLLSFYSRYLVNHEL